MPRPEAGARLTLACDFCHLPIPPADPSQGPHYCCYGCQLAADITRAKGESGRLNWMLTRMGLSVFLSMTVMMFSMYLYRQQGIDAGSITPLSIQLAGVMRYLCLIFSVPVFYMLGWPILATALESGRRGIYSTDALVVLGVAASFIYSYVSTLRDSGAVYFETGCVVLVFMTLGRWLEANGKLKASNAVASLESLFPESVTIIRDGAEQSVAPRQIVEGDLVIVPAGRRIAADGRIESGRAGIDESLVTGESTPVVREPGELVRAGTLNLDGALRIRATSVGSHSTLGRMIALLESARSARTSWERLTDRIAAIFVPLTLVLAAAGFLLGLLRGGLDEGLMSAMALMLIACPCALGIATPMAVWVALGKAARHGILFRGGEVIETLAAARAVCFDKTGTLTTGRAEVSAVHPAPGVSRDDLLNTAASLAEASNHPLSLAIHRLAQDANRLPPGAQDVRTVPGRGIIGTIGGRPVAIGNTAFMRDQNCNLEPELLALVQSIERRSCPLACIGFDARVRGVFEFSESLRAEARGAMVELQQLALPALVLTGDHAARATAIAGDLGVTAKGELTPEAKVQEITRLRETRGVVVMVGDGLNDAPALAAATVGIAMGCGADMTRENAGICLLGESLLGVPWAIRLARQTVRTIKINLFWAFAYNIIGMGLALAGRLNPIFAAFAMLASSVFVITNSLRLNQEPAASITAPTSPAPIPDGLKGVTA